MEKTTLVRTMCSFFFMTACLRLANCITLFDQSKSFAMYEAWNLSLVGNLRLRFKTQCQYCLVLYVDDSLSTYESEPTGAPDRARRAGKRGNYIQAALVLGSLHLEQQISYEDQTLTQTIQVGDQLNDLEWHELTVRKYENKITVVVDGSSSELSAPKLFADKFSVNSYLFIGGLSRVKEGSAYGKAKFIPRFVGCIEDISYSSGRSTSKTTESFVKGERITLTCLNSCLSNPCLNGGRCVNLFTRAGCDCFGTGFGGDRCSIAAQSIYTHGNGSLQWKHTRENADEPASIRIRFKAIRSEGTLFYQKSSSCEIFVRLLRGSLMISTASSEKGTVSRTVRGVDFLDGKWHTAEVNQRKNNISLIADREHIVWLTPSIVASPELSSNDILVLFGGLPRSSEAGQTSESGFHGCLQQLSYNQVDLVYKLYHAVDNRLSKVGEVRGGCSLNETHVQLDTHIEASVKSAARPTQSEVPIQNGNRNLEGSDLHLRDDRGIGQGVIVWITAAIVIGTIIIMISAACVVHHIRMKYSENVRTSVLKSGEETVQLNADRLLHFSGQTVSVRSKECAFTPKIFGKNTEVSVKFLRQEEQQTVL